MLPQGQEFSILNHLGTYFNSFQENATVCFFANYFNTTSALAFDSKYNDLTECTKRIVEEDCCYCWFIINHKSSEKKIKRTSETEKKPFNLNHSIVKHSKKIIIFSMFLNIQDIHYIYCIYIPTYYTYYILDSNVDATRLLTHYFLPVFISTKKNVCTDNSKFN